MDLGQTNMNQWLDNLFTEKATSICQFALVANPGMINVQPSASIL